MTLQYIKDDEIYLKHFHIDHSHSYLSKFT